MLDERLLLAAGRLRRPWLDPLVRGYSALGNNGIGWVVSGVAVAAAQGRPRTLVVTAALVWGTLALNFAVKSLVRRDRPGGTGALPPPLIVAPSSHSFPSSHAAMSMAATFALGPIALPFALAMAASRVYLAVHWPSDVLGGIALGSLAGLAASPRRMTMSIHIPAREGRAFRVDAGSSFRIIDPEGQQVADLFAFFAGDVREYLSAEHTRVAISRLFPLVGESWCTNLRRPILTFVADHSPGVHDMLCAACSPSRYALLGVEGHHASCEENLLRAMAGEGHPQVEVPQPVNIFENNPILADGSLGIEPAPTRPGDSVTLRAELDAIVVVTACPQDITVLCGGTPTALDIELL